MLRVMTYNLHHGEGVDGKLDLDRIAAVIRSAQPDLVALQEVDRKAKRTHAVDQSIEYARLTSMHGWFGAAMPFQGGEYGQVLLSRWLLESPRVIRLPGRKDHEPRIAVSADVIIPGLGRVRWAGVHLDASRDDTDRWEQVGALIAEFNGEEVPTLLVGDFNATPESRVMQCFWASGSKWIDTAGRFAAPTIPAEAPTSRIDYILGSPRDAWQTLDSRVVSDAIASDHRPVVATLRLGR